jgi:vacuolar-type H+-ATPase subunit H
MANQRQAERDVDQMSRKAAEQTSHAVSEAAERASRAESDALRRNADAFSNTWRTSSEAAGRIAERSTEQFSSLLGLNGDNATQSVEESAASVQALIDSSTVVTSGVQNISGEWMRFVQNRVGNNLKSFEEMMSCQTVHDCLAIQTRMVRDNWEAFLHTTRRASELSTKLADDAVKQMGDAAFAPR